MKHSLTEKDVDARTGVCSIDGAVKIQRSGNGWTCGVRANAQSRKQKAADPHRDRTSKTEHVLEWKDGETRTGVCRKCGPVSIVPYGRGWACGPRAKELGRVNHQDAPQTYCDACKLLDHDIVWLRSDGSCPRCSQTDLNAMFAADEADRRLMADGDYQSGFSVTGPWADPYEMPDLESAVPGWKTLG